MKKLVALWMAGMMALSLAACGTGTAETESASAQPVSGSETESGADAGEAEDVSERTQLVVGFDAEYPPYGYRDDNGEYVGFDLDLAQEVCDRQGWELVRQPIEWDSKDMELNSGTIDCIWNGFTVTGRETEYEWTVPYVDNSIVVVVTADSGIESLADLEGKVVETQADSSALAALTDEEDNEDNLALAATFADLQQVPDYNTAFMDLESGVADAIAVDIGVAQYQVGSRGDSFVILDEEISKEQYAVGFRLGNTTLRDTVQETLFEMLDDGTIDEIASRYEDYNIPDMLCLSEQER